MKLNNFYPQIQIRKRINYDKITNIKCLDDWYYELYDVCEDNTRHELCSIVDEKFRANSFDSEIKKMMGD